MSVALDVTPLIGPRSGVGYFVAEILDAMTGSPDIDLVPYALSLRARRTPDGAFPPGTCLLPLPAAATIAAWGRVDQPSAERWLRAPVPPGANPAGTVVDVVHGTNYVVPPTKGAAAVVTVHDCSFERFPELCSPAVRRFGPALRRAVARGAWVHTPSQFVAAEAAEIFGTQRVVAVPHGVPRLALPAVPLGGLTGDTPFILALGTLEPRKNVARLVEAFAEVAARHKGIRLLLVGADGPARPAVEAARAALPPAAGSRVRIAGYVDDRTRATLLAKAKVFAYPSLYEGFGFPVLEAMAAGTPVVAGNAGAIPEVAGEGAVLVDPTSVESIADGLCQILDDPALAGQLVRSGRRRAAGYSWRQAAEGLGQLYRLAADSR